jgi:deoxyuridine 5'-triphosphate nucleotidohydrolase
MATIPIFDGRDPLNTNVDDFDQDLQFYFHAKNVAYERRTDIFDVAIRHPAKREFDAKKALDHFGVRAQVQGDLANVAARQVYHELEYNARIQWLKNKYQGAEHREMIMNSLYNEVQSPNETPQQFLDRIEESVARAGLHVEVRDFTIRQIFLNGLQKDVAIHVRSQPDVSLANIKLAANNYWYAHYGLPAYRGNQAPRNRIPTQILTRPQPRYEAPAPILDPRPDPVDDDFITEFANLQAHAADVKRRYNAKYGPEIERFYNKERNFERPYSRRNQLDPIDQRPQRREQRQDVRCYRCQELGHYSKDCQSEMTRAAVPRTERPRPNPRQANVIEQGPQHQERSQSPEPEFEDDQLNYRPGYYSSDQDDELADDEYDPIYGPTHVYPVTRRDSEKRAKPYSRQRKQTSPTRPAASESMEQDDQSQQVPHSESFAEDQILKRQGKKTTRTYMYDPWKTIGNNNAGISIKELVELSPMVRSALQAGIRNTKPQHGIVSAIEQVQRTPAYAIATITGRTVTAIIDTGAGLCLMSITLLRRLGWKIDRASSQTLIVADGKNATVLGEIRTVVVNFGGAEIPLDNVVVTESTTYDIILGNDFLERIEATVDLGKAEVRFSWHGRNCKVPVDINRGIRESQYSDHSRSDTTPSDQVYTVQMERPSTRRNHRRTKLDTFREPLISDNDQHPKWQKQAMQCYSSDEEYIKIPSTEKRDHHQECKAELLTNLESDKSTDSEVLLYPDVSESEFWLLEEHDKIVKEEEKRIRHAKRCLHGPQWRKFDEYDPKPRNYWLANALSSEEYQLKKDRNQLNKFSQGNKEEYQCRYEDAEAIRLTQVAKAFGDADLGFVPTRLNCANRKCYYPQDENHIRCRHARQMDKLPAPSLVKPSSAPAKCPIWKCLEGNNPSSDHLQCALHQQWEEINYQRKLQREMGLFAPQIRLESFLKSRDPTKVEYLYSNENCRYKRCYWKDDQSHFRCRIARRNIRHHQRAQKLYVQHTSKQIKAIPTHQDCFTKNCWWQDFEHHRHCQRIRQKELAYKERQQVKMALQHKQGRKNYFPYQGPRSQPRKNPPKKESAPEVTYKWNGKCFEVKLRWANNVFHDQTAPLLTRNTRENEKPWHINERRCKHGAYQQDPDHSRCHFIYNAYGEKVFYHEKSHSPSRHHPISGRTTNKPLAHPVNFVHHVAASSKDPRPRSRSRPQPTTEPHVEVKPLNSKVAIPQLRHQGDAGFDLESMEEFLLTPGEIRLVDTGLEMKIPEGYYGKIESKSGMALTGLITIAGVIDSCYRGQIRIIVQNQSHRDYPIKIGDRIAQILFIPVLTKPLRPVKSFNDKTTRGKDGFGSTSIHNVRRDTKDKMNLTHQDTTGDKHAYHLGIRLTEDEKQQIHWLMQKYPDVLAVSFEELQRARTDHKHHIDTGDHAPIKKAPYRLPPHYKQWVRDEIEELKKNGIIRPSKSPWAFPIVIVPKKDGKGGLTPRMCIDYRLLNSITIKDAHPIPRISDILEYMPFGIRYITTLDLFMGYNQIGMTIEAILRSAFVTPDGHYEFTRMPFGLCNAPATFQRAMNEIFADLIGKGLYVYIDDITIYSVTFEEHMTLLNEVLSRLRRYKFYLKPKKCTIAAHKVDLLGHVIDEEGIRPSPTKIQAVVDYPRPTNKTELRAFLGLIGYYRHFIQDCSAKIEPLSRMLQEHIAFQWNDHGIEEATFNRIKMMLIDDKNLLIRPDFSKVFILQTDASALGLGAVLSQMTGKQDKPIAYASRRTSRTERNYGATQLETLAVVWAVKHFNHYLIGAPFRLITDHSAIRALMKLENPQGLYARWIMRLQPYDIDVVIKPGRLHQNADALSRIPHRKPHTPYFLERLPKRGPFLPDF